MGTDVETHSGASVDADSSFWKVSVGIGVDVSSGASVGAGSSSSTFSVGASVGADGELSLSFFLSGTYSTTAGSLLGATSISSGSRVAGPSSSRESGSLITTRKLFKKLEEQKIP